MTNPTPNKTLAAVCGLFCSACSIYIGTHHDPKRMPGIAERAGRPVEELHCDGCRAGRRTFYCQTCAMAACAAKKGIDFCGECPDYPCDTLQKFQAERPHRIELWRNLVRIKEVGYEQWFTEMAAHYACPECGTINSAYDMKCWRCGREPSCEYVEKYRVEFERFQSPQN